MSILGRAVQDHNEASAQLAQAEREMGARWRDAASRVVEQRYLTPLTVENRKLAQALAELDDELGRALRIIDEYL